MQKTKQIFTFGSGQKYDGGYCVIYGKTKEECREKMFKNYDQKWSMQYNTEEEAGVERFNLFLVKTIK